MQKETQWIKGEPKEIMRWGITCATLLVKSSEYMLRIIA